MTSKFSTALTRLQSHDTQVEIIKRRLRAFARELDELSEMSRGNAEQAKSDALRGGGMVSRLVATNVHGLRPGIWQDWIRLNERSIALAELASTIRCELATLRPAREPKPVHTTIPIGGNVICAEIAREGEEIDTAEGLRTLSHEEFDELVADQRRCIGQALPVQSGRNIVRGPVLTDVRVNGRKGERVAFIIAEIDGDTDPEFAAMINEDGGGAGEEVVEGEEVLSG